MIVPTIFLPLEIGSYDHLNGIVVSTIVSIIVWEGSKFIQKVVSFMFPWERSIVRHLIYEIIWIFVLSTVVLTAALFIYNHINNSFLVDFGLVVRNVFVAFVLALLFTAINEGAFLFNKWKLSLLEQEKLKKEALTAKLESLKKQLDPHFLFNSLSVLTGVIHSDPELAEDFVLKLSQVYRYVIEHNEEKEVTLKEELSFVQSYIFLLQVRFRDKIAFNVNQNVLLTNKKVIPLSLQLLVENAVKHNKMTSILMLDLYIENDFLWLQNNLDRREDRSKSVGIGLKNLVSRYEILINRTLQIVETESTFKVGIPLI